MCLTDERVYLGYAAQRRVSVQQNALQTQTKPLWTVASSTAKRISITIHYTTELRVLRLAPTSILNQYNSQRFVLRQFFMEKTILILRAWFRNILATCKLQNI
jgi:hypothetical protein